MNAKRKRAAKASRNALGARGFWARRAQRNRDLVSGRVAPKATNENVRRSMKGNKRANTKPEQVLRKMLREAGFPGYRLQWKKCPGHPDVAYPGRKIALFVHGCFWHRCPICNLPTPKRNAAYWEAKFQRNRERDERVEEALRDEGWSVVTIWEHDLKKAAREETSRYLYAVVSLDDRDERDALIERRKQEQRLLAKAPKAGEDASRGNAPAHPHEGTTDDLEPTQDPE